MKECSREKVLRGKKSQYDPLYPSRWSVGPGGQRDQEHGVVLHVQGEGYQPHITFRSGSSQVPKGLRISAVLSNPDLISLSYPNPVLNRTKSRTKYQSVGLTLLNARSSFIFILSSTRLTRNIMSIKPHKTPGQWT